VLFLEGKGLILIIRGGRSLSIGGVAWRAKGILANGYAKGNRCNAVKGLGEKHRKCITKAKEEKLGVF